MLEHIKRLKTPIIILLAVILGTVAIFTVIYLGRVSQYQETIKNLTFTDVDVRAIPDGNYYGEYDADLVGAKVEVTVQDGKITGINILEHKNERGAPAEKITETMILQQKIDVDAISGATNSSKAIKKAVENALLSMD